VGKSQNERAIILKADDQTSMLTAVVDGKLQARTSSWEDPNRDNDRLESALQRDCGSAQARGRRQNCSGATGSQDEVVCMAGAATIK